MKYENIALERIDPGICVLTIARAKVLNALNSATLAEMRKALQELAADATIRVVVLTGEGTKAFIAGADIAEMAKKNTEEGTSFAQLGHNVTKLLELMPKPTIAAVNGYALGGGTEIAISCDFIYAASNAVFGQPEVGLGIIPGFGGTLRLAKFVGFPKAKELIFSGRKIDAQEALQTGLAARVFPQEGFMAQAIEAARGISINSLHAISRAKRLLNEFSESIGLNYKLDAEAQEFGRLFGTFDQREGMEAFMAKRKPNFEGLK